MRGTLLIQLGTPDAPTAKALRRYLREFLSDPRVIEVPRWKWWWVLNLLVLPFRPTASAKKYQRIWNAETGSPLLHHTRLQTIALQRALPDQIVKFGMRYGKPSIAVALKQLEEAGVTQLRVLPLYPQYSGTTTGSALDGLFSALADQRVLPALDTIRGFHTHPAYIEALAARIEEYEVPQGQEPQLRLISFHGIPLEYIQKGDPYRDECIETANLLAQRMGWAADDWQLVFQSRFGRQVWLEPYADEVLRALPAEGVTRVLVVQPGFTTDCLETIDEIGHEYREEFLEAGGEVLHRVPCLNDHPRWIEAMVDISRHP